MQEAERFYICLSTALKSRGHSIESATGLGGKKAGAYFDGPVEIGESDMIRVANEIAGLILDGKSAGDAVVLRDPGPALPFPTWGSATAGIAGRFEYFGPVRYLRQYDILRDMWAHRFDVVVM